MPFVYPSKSGSSERDKIKYNENKNTSSQSHILGKVIGLGYFYRSTYIRSTLVELLSMELNSYGFIFSYFLRPD